MATTMDDAVVNAANAVNLRALSASAAFQESLTNAMGRLNLQMAENSANDHRLMGIASQQVLFANNLVDQKSAYSTPYQPGAGMLPAAQAKV